MNFFDHQDRARKNTFRLVLYFALAILFIIITIDLIFVGALIAIEPEKYLKVPIQTYSFDRDGLAPIDQSAVITLLMRVAAFISPTIIIFILLGTLWKIHSLKEGGIAVAKMVQAQEIAPDTSDFLERRFVNIVEEMSIASGVSVPKLYVMEDQAINAFVAGFKPEDTVMVVTRGALTQLSRDELQSVVGHEFSHIFNSDMQISLKIMGILGGLLLIGQAGYFLLRIFGNSSRRRTSSNSKSGGNIALAIIIIGLGLLIIGYVGLFFGRLIKAAVSRQRELLADASSVQFTRNPQGLVFALRRIRDNEKGTYLQSKNVEDISHLCFCTPRWIMFQNLLATHPPLDQRIDELDPEGQYKNLALVDIQQERASSTTTKAKLEPLSMMVGASVIASGAGTVNPTEVKNSIGNPTIENVDLAMQLLAQIPQELKDLAHAPDKVELVFYALILSYHEDNKEDVINKLSTKLDKNAIEIVISLSNQICALPKTIQLPLLDISLPTFKNNPIEKRLQIYHHLQEISSGAENKLFIFTLLTIIKKATDDKPPSKMKAIYNDFEPVITEISQLVSVILKVGAKDQTTENSDYSRLMKIFSSNDIARPIISNAQPIKFQEILTKLNLLTPLCKGKLVHVLLDCISEDNVVNLSEAELIRAIAASLGCPIPPIVATA